MVHRISGTLPRVRRRRWRSIKVRSLSEAVNRDNSAGEREPMCGSWGIGRRTCDFKVMAAVVQRPWWEVRNEHESRDKTRDPPVESYSCNCLDVLHMGEGGGLSTGLRRQCSCPRGARGSVTESGKIWLEVQREQGICSIPENGEGLEEIIEGAEMEVDVWWIHF